MDNDLIYSLSNISLLPWQLTIVIWTSAVALLLFLALIGMLFFRYKKKQSPNKIYTVSYLILFVFLLALGISTIAAISFLVDAAMGWGLSLLAGISVVALAVSIVKMLIALFGEMSLGKFFAWLGLSVISFSLILVLVATSLEKVHG